MLTSNDMSACPYIPQITVEGATVNECARLLLKHGAEQVDVLTLARAM